MIVIGLVCVLIAAHASEADASDTVTRWTSFSESSTCENPYTRTPYVSKSGWLSDGERILGPFGTYFGRSIDEVKSSLALWTAPGSGGRRILVHRAMLADLEQVAIGLRAEASKGRVYRISSISGFTPRTIGGAHQLSRHALGLAIDVNPAQNPYRSDGRLITDMPSWFIDVWRNAGFCWGGDWRYSKDPMHFSWIGPGSGSSVSSPLAPRTPKTSKVALGERTTGPHATGFSSVLSLYRMSVFDATGNGAPDVVGVRPHDNGSVIAFASSTYGYGECSIGRWFVEDSSLAGADHLVFGDVDGDSGQDLIALNASGDHLLATIGTRAGEFADLSTVETSLHQTSQAFTAADFDGDGTADLWEATEDGRVRIWSGSSLNELLHQSSLPGGPPIRLTAGDRDGGDTPELFALYDGDGGARIDVLAHDDTWDVQETIQIGGSISDVVAIGAHDYDGDGRSDVQVLDSSGSLSVYLGNTSTGVAPNAWFLHPDPDCGDDAIRLSYQGTFFDDDKSIFEADIESIAAVGVTRGCNPPFNDRFCPSDQVSRETMAAFLVRALGLTENVHPGFVDVPTDSTFAEDIGKLATAGITRGCNPPKNDRFCPRDAVTRETMAAFIVRALGLTENEHPGFVDVSATNTFVADIGRLATAGITRGCNPPGNDRYCPTDPVTREMMAAFLHRAGLGS